VDSGDHGGMDFGGKMGAWSLMGNKFWNRVRVPGSGYKSLEIVTTNLAVLS